MKVVVGALDPRKIAQAEEALREYPGAARKAMHDALRRMKSYLTRRAQEVVPQEYDITKSGMRKEGTVHQRINYTAGDGIEALTTFNGALIALYKFQTNPSRDVRQDRFVYVTKGGRKVRVSPGVPVAAHLVKNKPLTTIDNVFIAGMKNKDGSVHMGVWERTGKWSKYGNEKIRELTGNSIAHMVGYGGVADKLLADATNAFHARLDSNVQRIREGKWKI